jgi:hypothetical protein
MIRVPPELPGSELVERGIRDLHQRAETIEALLVSINAPGLRTLGLKVEQAFDEPELRLYRQLSKIHGDGAHSQYNALLRRMVSYQRAAQCAR